MKTLILTAIVLMLTGLTSCSDNPAKEKREIIDRTKGEWTHDQTEKAIDIYIDGLKQEEDLLRRNIELRQTLQFFDENRCARDVLKARRHEIDSLRCTLAAKRDTLAAISR
ncbi:MAG: hypothetical protein NC402_08195 [Prevotella sp.]|nr:hypothetical protein [Prevotella sp.]MCM1075128.1 hypothetical protein [Ruminococcus sp.]